MYTPQSNPALAAPLGDAEWRRLVEELAKLDEVDFEALVLAVRVRVGIQNSDKTPGRFPRSPAAKGHDS